MGSTDLIEKPVYGIHLGCRYCLAEICKVLAIRKLNDRHGRSAESIVLVYMGEQRGAREQDEA
jgi:hypothetical protein